MAGRYYMLSVSVDPTTILALGGLGEGGSYATPLGIFWSLEEQVDGFAVNTLLTEPGVLIGRALVRALTGSPNSLCGAAIAVSNFSDTS